MWPNEAFEAGPSGSQSQSSVSAPGNHRSAPSISGSGQGDSEQRMNVSNTNNGGIRRASPEENAREEDDGEERRGREGIWSGRSGLRKGEFFSGYVMLRDSL